MTAVETGAAHGAADVAPPREPRSRAAAAVLPALVPGAAVLFLAFQAGGFYPGAYSALAALAVAALALRVVTVGRPFAGISAWSGVAAAALALLGVWMLLSASWSGSGARALIEFCRLLMYLLVLVLCGSLAPRGTRLSWALRGTVLAIGAVCVAALITRLRVDLWRVPVSLDVGRLDYPVTYWNGLGMLAGVGLVLALHLSASSREPIAVRVLAAAVPPVAATTVYLTLSRGGIAATAIALVVYLLLGFTRCTPAALLAAVPACLLAVRKAYDATELVSPRFASPAGMAEGHAVAKTVLLAVALGVVLRAVGVGLDWLLARAPGPERLPRGARWGAVGAALVVAIAIALAAGAPGYADRQVHNFLSSSPQPASTDVRDRLKVFNNNGRVTHWKVAYHAFKASPLHGSGAGTFENLWSVRRPGPLHVLDAHSLYIEALGEMGVVGFGLIVLTIGTLLVGLAWRLRGPDRAGAAAVLAASTAWAVHAGVDWDWELTAVSVWMFGLAAIALAPVAPRRRAAAPVPAAKPPRRGLSRPLRVPIAIGLLVLALAPFQLWRSEKHLVAAQGAFGRGDCPTTISESLSSLSAVGARPQPWQLIAYCDVRLGQPVLAQQAAQAAVNRDPQDWAYHYSQALVRGALGQDPRPAAAAALRLNPLEDKAQAAVKAFKTGRKKLWVSRARKLPL
ncbi:MAG: hypothetical protein QOE28_1500 [Solirubrobacteraceae bacterium]|jgi:hypothetical protein|nr:hypothetical protein [Solirubrobacteraceae bacterium]